MIVLALAGLTIVSCMDDPGVAFRQRRTQDCGLYVNGGLVCDSCVDTAPDTAGSCTAAQCGVFDRCLRCTDPAGRTATDCSLDYEAVFSFSGGIGGGDTLSGCQSSFVPGAASVTCMYPGNDSCVKTEDHGSHCINCEVNGVRLSGRCALDEEPFPEPMAGRPDDLPARGACVSEPSSDDRLLCTACTRDNLDAVRTCSVVGVVFCDLGRQPLEQARCHLEDGTDIGVSVTPDFAHVVIEPLSEPLPDSPQGW